LLGADLAKAAAWVNAQPDWPRIEVVGDFMREQARDVIAAFPWVAVAEQGQPGAARIGRPGSSRTAVAIREQGVTP
jgi:hypothetical protein